MKLLIKYDFDHLSDELELMNYRVDANGATIPCHVGTIAQKLTALRRLGINHVVITDLRTG